MSQLQVQGLKKHYGSRVVVKDVSLEVTSGEVVGLLGPNGAGKTTCFYMIVGLVAVDDGAIHLDGREISHFAMHRRARMGLSYLPQEASVFRKLTVEENIRAVLELQELPEEEIESRLSGLLRDLNIAHLRQSTALSLSGGSAAASRSPGRSRRVRASYCSMNPSRASTRSRYSTFRKSSAFSRNAASASSSRTITCGKRWGFATTPTSSTTDWCSPSANRTRSFIMKT